MNSIKSMAALAVTGMLLWACGPEETQETAEVTNPFFTTYNTPFEVPPFDQIRNEHFKPAIEEGIRQHAAEIEAIANSEEAPTFENTIAAMDTSGALLDKVTSVFYPLSSANTNDSIQAIAKEVAPQLSAHSDNIRLNPKLFARVKEVWDKKDQLNLDEEQQMLLEDTYKSFVRSGANLSEADKEKLRGINEELSVLSLQFGQNILDETNNYQLVVENKEDLAGLPAGLVETAAAEAKEAGLEGKWVFTLHNPSVMPFLQYADNRELRKEIWNAYQMRGNNNNEFDNKENIRKMTNLRMERAQLLGYDSHADYVLEESMSKTPENVYKLLDQLWVPALEVAKQEAEDMQEMINASGEDFELAPYDWRYYTEKIRKQRYDLNAEEVKPYFSLEKVREGVFNVTNRLYGLKFEKLKDIPKYHEDVTAYEVKEADGTHVGVLYMDFFPRESKRGGAWMTSFRSQKMENGERKAPVISIVGNFTKPTEGAPALLTFDEVSTFYHEFGHALHGLLSDVKYESLAGTNVPRDFVELPSQIMENWASEPEVMKMYATHYETGDTIPDELIEKMKAAGTFNQGFATTEYLAASLLDLNYHTLKEPLTGEIKEFEEASMDKIGLIEEIIPRYRSTYFNHIFAGGYSSGYYSYIWSGVLDSDAFQAFKEKSLFDPELAASFRENVLERGGTREPMEMYVDFRGRQPDIQPLLEKRGLDKSGKTNIEVGN